MLRPWGEREPGRGGPAKDGALVVPSDTVNLSVMPDFLLALTGGTVRLELRNGLVFTVPVVAGEVIWVSPVRVHATGTTASVVALW